MLNSERRIYPTRTLYLMKVFFKNKTINIFSRKTKIKKKCPERLSPEDLCYSLKSGQKIFKDVSLQEKEAFKVKKNDTR